MNKLDKTLVYIISCINLVLSFRHFYRGNPFNAIYFSVISLILIILVGIFYLIDIKRLFKKNTQLLNTWTFSDCEMKSEDGRIRIVWDKSEPLKGE